MSGPPCPVCGSAREHVFSALVLERHEAAYLKCRQCGFLGVDRPSWLDEAYASPIAELDTGILYRSLSLVPRLLTLFRLVFPKDAVFVDVGAGYGVLVRAMRDAGLDFRWSDPFCPNLLARGFEAGDEPCAAVTAIEVLEHTPDPLAFTGETLERTGASVMVLTTELLPSPVPDVASWWYYSLFNGQHISFFERRTLDVLGGRLGLQVHSRRNFHVLHAGQVAPWQFTVAATRLASVTAKVLGAGVRSLTVPDSTLIPE